jgi:hypothetical protein
VKTENSEEEDEDQEEVEEQRLSTEKRQTRLQNRLKQASRVTETEDAGDEIQDDDGWEDDSEVSIHLPCLWASQQCIQVLYVTQWNSVGLCTTVCELQDSGHQILATISLLIILILADTDL